MTASGLPRRYIGSGYIDELLDRLSERDWRIVADVWRCRVLSGDHITRLHFSTISELTRQRTRRLVLAQLVEWGVLAPFDRRIGGVRGGSAGSVFALDVAGQRLVQARWPETADPARFRRPWTPGQLFVAHAVAISEIYVSLVELSRSGGHVVGAFTTEPLSWWPNGSGGFIKPDAYLKLTARQMTGHWWLEVDRATESLPTLQRKLVTYLDFVRRGQAGPNGIIPRVMLSVPEKRRRLAVATIIERLPSPAEELFAVATTVETSAQLAALVARPP